MAYFPLLPAVLLLLLSATWAKSLNDVEDQPLNEDARLALASHTISKRSLDYLWRALSSFGITTTRANATAVKSGHSLEADLKNLLGQGSSKQSVQRSKRSIHELHKLLKEQNDQLQRLLRTLPGGNLLTPVAHDPKQPHGIFNPLPLTNTLFFVNHDRTTQKPNVVASTTPATPLSSGVPEVTTASSSTEQPKLGAAGPEDSTTDASTTPGASTVGSTSPEASSSASPTVGGSTTSSTLGESSTAASTPGEGSTPASTVGGASTTPSTPAEGSTAPSTSTVSSTTAATDSSVAPRLDSIPSTVAPEASTTASGKASTQATTPVDLEPRKKVTSKIPLEASTEAPGSFISEMDGSGSLDEDHIDTNEPQVNIL